MGVKSVSTVTYVSDRGEEFELHRMRSSHILNVIHLHKKQCDTLLYIGTFYEPEHSEYLRLTARRQLLERTIVTLADELASRPHKDDYGQDEEGERYDYC